MMLHGTGSKRDTAGNGGEPTSKGRRKLNVGQDERLDGDDIDFMLSERPIDSRWHHDDSIEPPPQTSKHKDPDGSPDQTDLSVVTNIDDKGLQTLPTDMVSEGPWNESIKDEPFVSPAPLYDQPEDISPQETPACADQSDSEPLGMSEIGTTPSLEKEVLLDLLAEPERKFIESKNGEEENSGEDDIYDLLVEPVADAEDLENAKVQDWSKKVKLSRDEIIEGLAIEIIRRSGWTPRGIRLLVEALRPYDSYALVIRDLCDFLKVENPGLREFSTVLQLRSTWLEYGYSAGYSYLRGQWGLQSVSYKHNLDWTLGLMLVRSLGTFSFERIRLFLEDCLDDWRQHIIDVSEADIALVGHTDQMARCTLIFAEYLEYVVNQFSRSTSKFETRMPPELDYHWFHSDESIPDRRKEYRDIEDILSGLPGGSVWDE